MYSKAKIAGHPVHPMLVAFPIVSYVGALVSFVAYQASGDAFWFRSGAYCSLAGVVTALVAAVPGFIDWYTGIPRNTAPKRDGLLHAAANVTALVLFAVTLALTNGHWDDVPKPSAAIPLVLSFLGIAFTLAAGWLGSRLVYIHGVGVDVAPGEPMPTHGSARERGFDETRDERRRNIG